MSSVLDICLCLCLVLCAYVSVCMYVCMYVIMHACTHVCVYALHFGPTVHRGHYRTVRRIGAKIWLTEHNQPAEPLTAGQLESLSKQTYLVCCRRDSGHVE